MPLERLAEARALVVDGYSGEAGSALAEQAARLKVPVIGLDVDPAGARWCSLVVWSKHEHSAAEAENLPAVVLTDGSKPLSVVEQGRAWELTPPTVETTSAVGAGDAFGAMCCLGIVSGWDLQRTVRMAAAAGALVASSERGAPPPSLESVELLTKSY